jgi:hypothetical protein
MKKTTRKLKLAKETVRDLLEEGLVRRAVGGSGACTEGTCNSCRICDPEPIGPYG